MIQKKICLLGGFGVGKTSLVSRFVHSMFSDKYLTTIGVKIEKKSVDIDDTRVELVIWDIYGHDDFQKLQVSYLRGAGGYVLVADGTRRATLNAVFEVHQLAREALGKIPFVLAINKADLRDQWEIDKVTVDALIRAGWPVVQTSAKTGDSVEEMFSRLAYGMVAAAL